MASAEMKVLADIEHNGCHIVHVSEEGDLPPFSYSIGIQHSCGAPELLVIGLKQPTAEFAINEYNRHVRTGFRFRLGNFYEGFIEGFETKIQRVHHSHFKDYMGWGVWFYKNSNFKALQLVYPTTEGVWPWDETATEWFRNWQPVLEAPKDCLARQAAQ